ncbi:hypothetical protein [Bathymodiolus platifrons methanotrophic gill symbiont]|uniref:hypothetical protein n=1 Tax=Bathymodiolus platifrons methanotrophic gill symbiont TaxID=113268 RepID=UPI001C8E948A|nr:hypothetical protein [Bathymodiolus platifrons methanotrophic gill symbiont]
MSQKSIRHAANHLCPGPPRVRLNYATKPCSVKAPTHGLTAIRNAILCLPRALSRTSDWQQPCAFWRLSSRPGLTAKENSSIR